MSKQAGDHLIPVHASANFRHRRMAGIDLDRCVVRTSAVSVLGCPVDIHVDTPVIPIPFCLGCSHILKMSCQDPGGKELSIRDLAAFLIEQLLHSLMIHLCHIRSLLSL